jgi:hypothetical protein
MTQPVNGLSAIAGYQVIVDQYDQATPEERSGSPANPAHAQPSPETSIPRGSRIGPAITPIGPENQLLSPFDEWSLTPAGNEYDDPYFDHTPSRRAGPHPRGILSGPLDASSPNSIANQTEQSAILHGIKTNAPAHSNKTIDARNDEWETVEQVNSGNSDLVPLPRQSMSSGYGFGTRDRTQSFALQNEYGYDSYHQHRRYAVGSIPGNSLWMVPQGRVMVKHPAGPARPPIGVDSPFTGQDLGAAFGVDGALLQNVPTEYSAPPQPSLAPSIASDVNDSVVEWY